MGTRFDRPSVSLTAKLSARQVEAAFKLLDKREKKVGHCWFSETLLNITIGSNVNSGLPIAPPVTPSSSLQKVLNEGLAGGWQDISQQEESSGGVTERGQAASAMSMVHYFGHNAIVGQRRRPSSARYPSQEQRHSICNSTPTRRPQSAQNRLTDEKSKGGISGLNSHRHPMTAPSPSNGSGQGSFGQNHFSIFAEAYREAIHCDSQGAADYLKVQ
ncbi:hypothetical protein BSKO_02945 [Bryopsis sp. KO-2023]|nr:hypothetical protein BSKO_02945 [Bryopsis sp. KO-2023]